MTRGAICDETPFDASFGRLWKSWRVLVLVTTKDSESLDEKKGMSF